MQNLIADIEKTVKINGGDLDKIITRFHEKSFGKNAAIPSFKKISHHFKFIESGLVRVYFIDNQAREITIQIGIENAWIADLHSFLTQTPSQYHIDVLEPTTILQIHRSDLKKLFVAVPVAESFFRLKIQRAYISLQDRTLHQMNKSAEERYLEFRDKYGHIEARVPQYMIASYLNISPEHLSKVRNKLAAN
ncbi:Crp/Fnr family transcriptional regulator [Fulvivirgaceae bacterium BMA12]|uniref:Crp/Fnr family transcriptional regulator n=1 Tax=Agaribacillus aureus TaxID=3051825 RepID=A0ABT8LGQ9_9BACT|nr:Crp/Fnr family transcriptional regulator [Fulvivirgaceae bacterium BMA12]